MSDAEKINHEDLGSLNNVQKSLFDINGEKMGELVDNETAMKVIQKKHANVCAEVL